MIAGQVSTRPEDLPRTAVEGRRPVAAEVDVDASLLDDGSGRRVAVVHPRVGRRRHVEELGVEENAPVVAAEGHDEKLLAVRGGGGQPDLSSENHRRRPTAPVDRRLPGHVLGLAPLARQAHGFGVPGPGGTAELRPLVGRSGQTAEGEEEGQQGRANSRTHGGLDSTRELSGVEVPHQ